MRDLEGKSNSQSGRHRFGNKPLQEANRIVAGYFVVAGSYILASDRLVGAVTKDPETILRISLLKGWLFVSITALFLAILVRRLVHKCIAREADLHNLVQTVPDMIWVKDLQGRYVSGNPPFFAALGLTEKQIIGHRLEEVSDDDRAHRIADLDKTILETGLPVNWVEASETPDGKRLFYAISKLPIRNANDEITGIVGVSRDITEHKATEESLRHSEQQFRAVVESSPNGVLMIDESGRITLVNKEIERAFGYSRRELIGKAAEVLLPQTHANDHLKFRQYFVHSPQGQLPDKPTNITGLHKDGREFPIQVGLTPVRAGSGAYVLATVRDLSEQVSAEEKIRNLVLFDNLTALPNRNLFHQQLIAMIAKAETVDGRVSLLTVDLDRFKGINDLLGFSAGDQVLKEIAQRLTEALRDRDFIARVGADEFAVVAPNTSDVASLAQKIKATIERPIEIGERTYQLTASIGISSYPGDANGAAELQQFAELALGQAKQSAAGSIEFYSEVLTHRSLRRMAVESALRGALERNEFSIHYQPVVDLASGRSSSAEALLRWRHPDLGQVSPAEFIPIAEETDLIGSIGEWVLRQACNAAGRWVAAGKSLDLISVNLSPRQFHDDRLCETVLDTLEAAGLEPKHLQLEVTEGMIIENPEASVATLRHLRNVGIRIAMDDFGTGYSSLAYLKHLPLDRIKIDRSFVKDLPDDAESAAIVRSIIGLALGLQKVTIAEGVETLEQAALLSELGCESVQGYYFSRPLPEDEYEAICGKSWHPETWQTRFPRAA